jgi:hypothetical protein
MPFTEHLMGLGTPGAAAAATAGSGATGLVATGSTAADALQLSASWNTITTSSASTGVKLPNVTGGFCGIRNDSGQTITVYPYSTATTVNAAAASVTLATAKTMLVFWTSATTVATITGV